MNGEIKEILEELRKTADNTVFAVCCSQEELDKIPKYTANFMSINDRKAKQLLNYITNLQEENEDLREENKEAHDFDKTMKDIKENLIARINRQECEIHNLKAIIDKAIEYIEEKGRLKYKPDELINILQGSDKE